MATKIGTVIDGKFKIIEKIGEGGMSVVYLARDNRLNKQWAVKEIKKTADKEYDRIIVDSLLAEADLLKGLDHSALPRILDIIGVGETIYEIMDYVEGESLDKVMKKYGSPLPEEMVVNWAVQTCGALSYLHSQNPPIIHRDIKPENLMLNPEGNIKVIDLGIAREHEEKQNSQEKAIGTPGYAPPEQSKKRTDARSDIFALGMTMHCLLTGIDPRTKGYTYFPVRQRRPEISEGLEAIIDKCVAEEPENRYQNCDELIYYLQHSGEPEKKERQKKKRKLITFIASMSFSIVMLGTGIAGQVIAENQKKASYESKVSEMTNTYSYEDKVKAYLEAIQLDGTKTEAYEKLLKAYEDNGKFTEAESGKFRNAYERNEKSIVKNTDEEIEAYLNLAYKAGMMYFYMYSDNEGNMNFRTGLLKSEPFFRKITEFKQEGYEYNIESYEYYRIAASYVEISDFFSNYMDNSSGVKEPAKEDYDLLLTSFRTCIENVDTFNTTDAYNKLLMYEQIANLLNTNSLSMAQTGVEEETVLALLQDLKNKTASLGVTQQKSVELQESILENAEIYLENIQRRYKNENTYTDIKESEETADE